MEIKTKYGIGDKVYFLCGMRIFTATIESIKIDVSKIGGEHDFRIKYDIIAHSEYVNFIPQESPINENLLFGSAQELINNIKNLNKI